MSKIRFKIENISDEAELTATNPDSDFKYDVDNIKRISRLKSFRSANTNNTTIEGTLTEARDVSAFVIARHNFSTQVTFKLELFSDANLTDPPIYTTGDLPVEDSEAASDLWQWGEFNWGTIVWGGDRLDEDTRSNYNITRWLDDLYTIQSFRLTIGAGAEGGDLIYCNNASIYCNDATIDCNQLYTSGSGSPADTGLEYYEIGRLFIGEYLAPAYNISYGHSMGWSENTKQYRPNSGTLQSNKVSKNRRFEFSLRTIPESERYDLHNRLFNVGLGEEFFISMFPEDDSGDKRDDYSGIVKFTKIPRLQEFYHTYYRSNYIVEEA